MLAAVVVVITLAALLALVDQVAAAQAAQVALRLLLEQLIQAEAVVAEVLHLPLQERVGLAVPALSFFLFPVLAIPGQQPGHRQPPPAAPTRFSPSRHQGATQHEPLRQSSGWQGHPSHRR
jgi:hypothetical protein